MKLKLFLITIVIFLQVSAQKSEIYSKAQIFINNKADIENLLNNGIAADHGIYKKNVYIESVFSQKELNIAKKLGYDVTVVIPDMKKHISELKNEKMSVRNPTPCSTGSSYETPQNFNLGTMGGFLTLSQMLQELDDMHNLYPNLITQKAPIGNYTTFEGRSIYLVKISDNPTVDENEPKILFTGIHHAREPAAMQQLIFYMWYLLENYATNAEVQELVNNTQQFFVPIVNPDGYRYNETTNPNGGGFWRKNRRPLGSGNFGIDNNRNYGWHWGESGVSGPNGETYPGTNAFSEPENQAIKYLCENNDFTMAINNHTYSSLLLFPFGYAANTPTPENQLFTDISALMVAENGYTNEISSELYPAAGDSDDWMYGDTTNKNKIYAMTPEIGTSFWPNQNEIIPLCKSMVYHNLTAAHLITNYAKVTANDGTYITTINSNINFNIKRLGIKNPGDFTVSITPISSNIVGVGNAVSFTGMQLSEQQTASISLNLNPSIESGDLVEYAIDVNNGSYTSSKIISRYFGTPTTDFSLTGNSTTDFNTTNWNTTTETFYSASLCIADSPYGFYQNNTDSSITLANTIDLTNKATATVSFWAKWDIEAGYDFVQFEISTDLGNSWQPQCGKYTKNGVIAQGIPNQPMYDGNQADWVKEQIDLSSYIGEHILFRFRLVSDTFTTGQGFFFDDFKIESIAVNQASVDDLEFRNIQIYPNPSENIFTIEIPNSKGIAKISIYSITGQLVKEFSFENNVINFETKNLETGIYFLKIKLKDKIKTFKISKK